MEQSRRLTALERAIGAALLAAIGLAGFLESRTTLARATRAQRPWIFELTLGVSPAQNSQDHFLGVYNPRKPGLELVYIPENARKDLAKIPALADAMSNFAPAAFQGAAAAEDSPPLEALRWAKNPARNLLVRPLMSRTPEPEGLALRGALALRLAQIPEKNIIPAWLPDAKDARYDFLGRLLSGRETPSHPGPITVEILNASGVSGLALDATKILRSRGADVMSSGNAQGESARTVVYDRTGRFENARAVASMLECPSAEIMTRADPTRLVDVSVILAQDCARTVKRSESWN